MPDTCCISMSEAFSIGSWHAEDRVLIVAEIGNNHEGSHARAETPTTRRSRLTP
jgi:hypothetical protein